jgi:hypothetical protein
MSHMTTSSSSPRSSPSRLAFSRTWDRPRSWASKIRQLQPPSSVPAPTRSSSTSQEMTSSKGRSSAVPSPKFRTVTRSVQTQTKLWNLNCKKTSTGRQTKWRTLLASTEWVTGSSTSGNGTRTRDIKIGSPQKSRKARIYLRFRKIKRSEIKLYFIQDLH